MLAERPSVCHVSRPHEHAERCGADFTPSQRCSPRSSGGRRPELWGRAGGVAPDAAPARVAALSFPGWSSKCAAGGTGLARGNPGFSHMPALQKDQPPGGQSGLKCGATKQTCFGLGAGRSEQAFRDNLQPTGVGRPLCPRPPVVRLTICKRAQRLVWPRGRAG